MKVRLERSLVPDDEWNERCRLALTQAIVALMDSRAGDLLAAKLSHMASGVSPLPESLDSYAVRVAYNEGYKAAAIQLAHWIDGHLEKIVPPTGA